MSGLKCDQGDLKKILEGFTAEDVEDPVVRAHIEHIYNMLQFVCAAQVGFVNEIEAIKFSLMGDSGRAN